MFREEEKSQNSRYHDEIAHTKAELNMVRFGKMLINSLFSSCQRIEPSFKLKQVSVPHRPITDNAASSSVLTRSRMYVVANTWFDLFAQLSPPAAAFNFLSTPMIILLVIYKLSGTSQSLRGESERFCHSPNHFSRSHFHILTCRLIIFDYDCFPPHVHDVEEWD